MNTATYRFNRGSLLKERGIMLTQRRIKELLRYNKETGFFAWKIRRQGVTLGSKAGRVTSKGYTEIMLSGESYGAHRLAFLYVEGAFPGNEVDHVNHDRSDNRWRNLRKITRDENHRNLSIFKNNTSGHQGVCWKKAALKYVARIHFSGVAKHLGYYPEIEDAIQARKEAEIKYGFHENHGKG